MEIKQLWKPFENFLNSHTLDGLHFNGIRKIQSEMNWGAWLLLLLLLLMLLLWRFCAAVARKQEWHHATKWSQQTRNIFKEHFLQPNFLDPRKSTHNNKNSVKRVSEYKDKEREREAEKPVGLLLASNFYWNF